MEPLEAVTDYISRFERPPGAPICVATIKAIGRETVEAFHRSQHTRELIGHEIIAPVQSRSKMATRIFGLKMVPDRLMPDEIMFDLLFDDYYQPDIGWMLSYDHKCDAICLHQVNDPRLNKLATIRFDLKYGFITLQPSSDPGPITVFRGTKEPASIYSGSLMVIHASETSFSVADFSVALGCEHFKPDQYEHLERRLDGVMRDERLPMLDKHFNLLPHNSIQEPQVIADYMLHKELGRGGYGSVDAAAHIFTCRPIAFKRIHFYDDPEFLRSYNREVGAMRAFEVSQPLCIQRCRASLTLTCCRERLAS